MAGWVERWQRRRLELAEGADADLMLVNRRRYRVAFSLIVLAFVLGFLDAKFRLPHILKIAFRAGVGVFGVVGMVLAKWAQHERAFLTEPDPERPPEIFRND